MYQACHGIHGLHHLTTDGSHCRPHPCSPLQAVAQLEQIELHLQALEDQVAQAISKTPRSARGK